MFKNIKEIFIKTLMLIFQIGIFFYLLTLLYASYQDYKEATKYTSQEHIDLSFIELEEERRSILYGLTDKIENPNAYKEAFKLYLSTEDRERVEQTLLRKTPIKELEPYNKNPILKIESLGIEVPTLATSINTTSEELEEYLKGGVVRYSEKDLIHNGATVIYGHSSQPLFTTYDTSFFKRLPLSSIGHIATFEEGENIFEYEAIETKEVLTRELEDYINHFDELWEKEGSKYVILVTCYPINTTRDRWVIVYKRK